MENQEPEQLHASAEPACFASIHPVQESVAVLFERLAELQKGIDDPAKPEAFEITSQAIRYVRSHISETIRVDELARKLGLSASTLNLVLKKQLTCSTHELIAVVKMLEAKRLLDQGDLLVKEVADRLGFDDPYYFSSRFKFFFGVSPRKFKRHYQQRRLLISNGFPNRRKRSSRSEHPDIQRPHVKLREQHPGHGRETLPAGTAVDRFVIVNVIGRGGMGVVYKAFDPKLNRGVALKLIRADHSKLMQSQNRLLREAQALARLSHPNVLHVYDVGISGAQVFIAMALVEGETLEERLKGNARPVVEILKIMTAAGRGLSAAHRAGLVHRDFKPSNVIIGDDGQVRVLDFGLAREIRNHDATDSGPTPSQSTHVAPLSVQSTSDSRSSEFGTTLTTEEGDLLGTPPYMAPEQYLGQKIDQRTDVFSFCVVLYEALYGKRPFEAKSMGELKSKIIQQQIDIPANDRDIPHHLWQMVRKGLNASPADRYQTMASLLDELNKKPENSARLTRRKRKPYFVAFAIFVLAIVLSLAIDRGLRARSVHQCNARNAEMAGVWNSDTKARIRQAFLTMDTASGPKVWKQVERNIGSRVVSWEQMVGDTCEARFMNATLSEDSFSWRMRCLHNAKHELESLVKVLVTTEPRVIYKAVEASAALKGIANCTEPRTAPHAPPNTLEQQTQVTAIRSGLAQVEALLNTGSYKDGLHLAKQLKQEAEEIGYSPLQAEVSFLEGRLQSRMGDYRQAESTLYSAVSLAAKGKDPLLMTKAIASIAWIVGIRQARHDAGLSLGRAAEGMLDFLGGDVAVEGRLLATLGAILEEQGKFDEALVYHRKSLVLWEKKYGPDHPNMAPLLINLGSVFLRLGEFEKALEYFRRSLAIRKKWLGPEHPQTSTALFNIGDVLSRQGKYERALVYLRKALAIEMSALGSEHSFVAYSLAGIGRVLMLEGNYDDAIAHSSKAQRIWEKALGAEHPLLAGPLACIGNSLVAQDRPERALEPLERLVTLCAQATCDPEPHGAGQFALARALVATTGDTQRASDLAKQARETYRKTPGVFDKEIDAIHVWLGERDG